MYVVPRAVTAIVQRGEACTLVMRGGNGLDINEGADEALRRIDRANSHARIGNLAANRQICVMVPLAGLEPALP